MFLGSDAFQADPLQRVINKLILRFILDREPGNLNEFNNVIHLDESTPSFPRCGDLQRFLSRQ